MRYEVWYSDEEVSWRFCLRPGWYWWPCQPGCLPDGEAQGPFDTMAEAVIDAEGEGEDQ